MSCDAAMRPFRPVNDTEVHCDSPMPCATTHRGTLRDYAYPGSATVIEWIENDRRTFHGDWPGGCIDDASCILPLGHEGNHAS